MRGAKSLSLLAFILATGLALTIAACAGPVGPAGPAGPTGPLPPGVARELDVQLAVSKPANGTHFLAAEAPVVTVTIKDQFGQPFVPGDLSTLALYMYGPQETTKTVTAVKMLNATADRTKTPHHYIDLLTNADVKAAANVLTYTLKPVSDEEAGTYTVTLRAVLKADPLQQVMKLVDLQIKTATVEKQIVEKTKCIACHEGADSKKVYLHHVDPTGRSPTGSWSLDFEPVRSCKSCHNNEGYAAYPGNIADPTGPSTARTPDQIVRRVHGVHMGKGLKNPFNIDPATGSFKVYTGVIFPANVKNCTTCHVDDRWKTQPSRLACGACHDNTWFGAAASMPKTAVAHPGGAQPNDSACATCHPADAGGVKAVAVAHKVEPPAFQQTVDMSMTPPANGKFYVAGERPKVTITLKNAATGAIIDPATLVEPKDPRKVAPNEWSRANFYVSGPRQGTMPVLTAAAAKHEGKSYAANELRVLQDPSKADPRLTRTATSLVYQLDDVAGLKVGTYTAFVEVVPSAPIGGWKFINFQVGTEKPDKTVATNCTTCHADTRMHASFFAVQFNPDICKNCHDYTRQTPGKIGWAAVGSNYGFGAAPLARRVHGVHFGRYLDKPKEVHQTYDYSEVIFPQDVRNCTKCHAETSTWKEKPSRLACLACHDKDAAITHAAQMTSDPTSADPWSGDEQETCVVCHGKDREFSPDKVHNVAKPYKPPYFREPAE